MKVLHRILFILSVAFFVVTPAHADGKGIGVGVIVGEPTGLSFKAWLNETHAIDGGFAWSFLDDGSVHLHVDYLAHNYGLFQPKQGQLPLYYGLGMRVKLYDDKKDRYGLRVPIGMAYEFDSNDFDIFVEMVPVLDVAPKLKMSFNAAIGARYYF